MLSKLLNLHKRGILGIVATLILFAALPTCVFADDSTTSSANGVAFQYVIFKPSSANPVLSNLKFVSASDNAAKDANGDNDMTLDPNTTNAQLYLQYTVKNARNVSIALKATCLMPTADAIKDNSAYYIPYTLSVKDNNGTDYAAAKDNGAVTVDNIVGNEYTVSFDYLKADHKLPEEPTDGSDQDKVTAYKNALDQTHDESNELAFTFDPLILEKRPAGTYKGTLTVEVVAKS